jgi:hypothetical protein
MLEEDSIPIFGQLIPVQNVILSAAAASQSEADAESKDPVSAWAKINVERRSHKAAQWRFLAMTLPGSEPQGPLAA